MRAFGNSLWTLNKLIVLLLLGGFLILLPEIRFDHSDVLAETWKGYIPLVYCAAMVLISLVGLACWDSFGRQLLLFGFTVALIVGALGFYFHNQRNVVGRTVAMVATLAQPVAKKKKPAMNMPATSPSTDGASLANSVHAAGGAHAGNSAQKPPAGIGATAQASGGAKKAPKPLLSRNSPPVFAPLSFIGLGLIGILVCMKRFQPGF